MKPRKIRYILLAIMAVLTAGSLSLFSSIKINEDMTRYLPDESLMKEGVDTLKHYFPDVKMNAYFIKVMFKDLPDKDATGAELAWFDGISGITAVSEKDGYTMYQLSVDDGADPKAITSEIKGRYGESAVIEHNANSIMPDNMILILIIGTVMVFGILFLMCSSFAEAILFIITIGMAVILNMGTNALLPSVSMMTNTIVAVLQLVLSMDYSIILMNRFRQVLQKEPDIDRAMHSALKSASTAILSSSLTTIVGLLALVFMKFKIGLDLGLVLAKGVFFSLISTYTILPALILFFYKGIRRTEKKVFLMPTDRLASFEYKARIPLAILFIIIFGTFCLLSQKTELSYASIWESRINEIFTPQNPFSLIYRTSAEDKTVAITDSIFSDPKVNMTLSYPSIFKKELTAEEMCGNIRTLLVLLPSLPGAEIPDIPSLSAILTPETVRILYYAASHPERDEKMSFDDMLQLASEASKAGLLPKGMDIDAMIAEFIPSEPEETTVQEISVTTPSEPKNAVIPQTPHSGTESAATPSAPSVTTAAPDVTPAAERTPAEKQTAQEQPETESRSLADIAKPAVDESGEDPYKLRGKYHFTKEKLHTQMNSTELAEYLGFSKGQASVAYSLARKKNGTMTPDEFIDYMINNVLGKKLLRKLISDKQAEGLYYIRSEMDAVLAAPDTPAAPAVAESEITQPASTDSVPASSSAHVHNVTHIHSVTHTPTSPDTSAFIPSTVTDVQEETPMDRLARMYASGRKYSSMQVFRALHNAGIDVADKGAIDLMFTYYGSKYNYPDTLRMSLDSIINFLSSEVASNDAYAKLMDDSTRAIIGGLRETVDEGMKMIRGSDWSMAAIVTEYPLESTTTFDFVENAESICSASFDENDFYLIGESVMYKEMKDGFRSELVFLTLLTVISIFLIVAFAFRSFLIPSILIMTVLTGVYANVFFSGLGGSTMLYLAYLIVQSILMGATIDYGILYTNYYLGFRRKGQDKADALKNAYRGSIHTIMTSGLIIIIAPFVMAELLTDPTIRSILMSLSFGALASISLILFVLPAVLSACDNKYMVSERSDLGGLGDSSPGKHNVTVG